LGKYLGKGVNLRRNELSGGKISSGNARSKKSARLSTGSKGKKRRVKGQGGGEKKTLRMLP